MDRLSAAIAFASNLFSARMDKRGAEPMLFHSLHVLMEGRTESERIVGVLHDVCEDFGLSPDFLASEFDLNYGERHALELLTHDKNDPYVDYLNRIRDSGNEIALYVKIVDVNHNLSRIDGLPEKDRDRLEKKYKNAITILNGGEVGNV